MELDDADLAILRALQQDSRRSCRALARLAGVSTPTASSKVKSLQAKGALRGFAAQLSPEALGEQVLLISIRARPSALEGAAKKLAALPEVRACHTLGSGRAVAFATLVDPSLASEFLGRLSSIQEIDSVDSFPLLKTVKDLPLAIVDRGVMLAVRCEFCGRRTKDAVLRVKVGSVTHFVCCKSCKTGFEERSARLARLAGKGARRSDLKIVDG
jgi:DNA-binding Lrp family transcriptional regulator